MSKFVKVDEHRLVNLDYVSHISISGSKMTFYLSSSEMKGFMTREFDTPEECEEFFTDLMGI